QFFDGDDDEAMLETLRLNVRNGLPLRLEERKQAAAHLLRRHPSWSDRSIAATCGLSAGTIAGVRASLADASDGPSVEQFERRVGRDGRARPVDPKSARARVAAEIAK